jgi:hypothetical protein
MAIPIIYSLRSIAVRKASSAMAVGGIALVVVVFVTLLSLAAGFRKVVTSSGSPHNVIVVRKGADAECSCDARYGAHHHELPLVGVENDRKLAVFESVIMWLGPK